MKTGFLVTWLIFYQAHVRRVLMTGEQSRLRLSLHILCKLARVLAVPLHNIWIVNCGESSEFVSSSIPS